MRGERTLTTILAQSASVQKWKRPTTTAETMLMMMITTCLLVTLAGIEGEGDLPGAESVDLSSTLGQHAR